MAMIGGNKPTNIDRIADLIDLDVEAGQTVEIEQPMPTDSDVTVEFGDNGEAQVDFSLMKWECSQMQMSLLMQI